MKPGQELDLRVHLQVMGATDFDYRVEALPSDPIPPYSTDIAAAWQVVERMWEHRELTFKLTKPVGGGFNCTFQVDGFPDWASTAPHAICLAALKAVGVQ